MLAKFTTKTLAALCIAALLGGCFGATIQTDVGKDEYGNPYFHQEISGNGKVVIDAAAMNFKGTVQVNPETGELDLEINSGQDAQGVQSAGVDLAALVEPMKLVQP